MVVHPAYKSVAPAFIKNIGILITEGFVQQIAYFPVLFLNIAFLLGPTRLLWETYPQYISIKDSKTLPLFFSLYNETLPTAMVKLS